MINSIKPQLQRSIRFIHRFDKNFINQSYQWLSEFTVLTVLVTKRPKKSNVHLNIRYSTDKSYWNFIDDVHFALFIPRTNVRIFNPARFKFPSSHTGFNEIYSQGVEKGRLAISIFQIQRMTWKTRMEKVKNSNFSVKRIYIVPMGAPRLLDDENQWQH